MKGLSHSELCCYCHTRARQPGRKVCSDRCDQLRKESYARSNAKRRGTPLNPKRLGNWKLLTPICPGCGKIISAEKDCTCAEWISAPKERHHDIVRVLDVRTMKTRIEVK